MQPHQRMTQAIKAKQETSAPILKCELATFHYFDVLLSYISLLLLLSLFLSGNNHSQIRQQAVLTYHCWPIRIPLPFAPDQNPFLNQLWLYNEKIEFLFLKGNTDKTVNSPHLVSLLSCSWYLMSSASALLQISTKVTTPQPHALNTSSQPKHSTGSSEYKNFEVSDPVSQCVAIFSVPESLSGAPKKGILIQAWTNLDLFSENIRFH